MSNDKGKAMAVTATLNGETLSPAYPRLPEKPTGCLNLKLQDNLYRNTLNVSIIFHQGWSDHTTQIFD